MPDGDFERVLVARRVLAGFFALSWFTFPGFGLIDLSVTWDPEWPQVLEAGWGLYMTLFVGVPFTVFAVRGRAALQAAAAQLYVAVGGSSSRRSWRSKDRSSCGPSSSQWKP